MLWSNYNFYFFQNRVNSFSESLKQRDWDTRFLPEKNIPTRFPSPGRSRTRLYPELLSHHQTGSIILQSFRWQTNKNHISAKNQRLISSPYRKRLMLFSHLPDNLYFPIKCRDKVFVIFRIVTLAISKNDFTSKNFDLFG